jgi:hypothetical protein
MLSSFSKLRKLVPQNKNLHIEKNLNYRSPLLCEVYFQITRRIRNKVKKTRLDDFHYIKPIYVFKKVVELLYRSSRGKRHRFSESKNNCLLIEPNGCTKARLLYGHFILNQHGLY